MTETDVESIWDTTWATARFDKINVRIAEVLNFIVTGDATSQVTSTACTPIMEQISEEILFELANAAKANKFSDIWGFIQANISKMSWKYYDNYLLEKVRKKLGQSKLELVRRTLPSSTSDW